MGSDLLIFHGYPIDLIPKIAKDFSCNNVFTNRDYEPYAIKRDRAVYEKLKSQNIESSEPPELFISKNVIHWKQCRLIFQKSRSTSFRSAKTNIPQLNGLACYLTEIGAYF